MTNDKVSRRVSAPASTSPAKPVTLQYDANIIVDGESNWQAAAYYNFATDEEAREYAGKTYIIGTRVKTNVNDEVKVVAQADKEPWKVGTFAKVRLSGKHEVTAQYDGHGVWYTMEKFPYNEWSHYHDAEDVEVLLTLAGPR